VTGEVQLDSALQRVVQEAIDYRLEYIAAQVHALEQKYALSFARFDAHFWAGEIPHQHSYAVFFPLRELAL
jgi:hypothetical protein